MLVPFLTSSFAQIWFFIQNNTHGTTDTGDTPENFERDLHWQPICGWRFTFGSALWEQRAERDKGTKAGRGTR